MNHYEQGLRAFHARQFLEAQVHFEQAANQVQPEEELNYKKCLFECSKVLSVETCWKQLRDLTEIYVKQQAWDELLSILNNEENLVPINHREFIYRQRCLSHFERGALELSRENAIQHLDLLLKKKIYHQLAIYTATYCKWFPYMAYFQFIKLEAYLSLSQTNQIVNCIQDIIEMLHRKWSKLDDNHFSSKQKLIQTAYESIQNQEHITGEIVLQGHYLYLNLILLQQIKLNKEDWKKLLEILVYEDSWRNLKLALEISIAQDEQEIAREIYKHLKNKKSFSIVKLTKYDPMIKVWAIKKKEDSLDPKNENELSNVNFEHIKIESVQPPPIFELEFNVDDEIEYKAIELNAIKQLSLNVPSWESLLDILIAYKTFGFKRVVSYLLLEAEKMVSAPVSFKKKISYMKVVHALDCNQRFLALSIIEEMLGGQTIELDEYMELKYVQGSVLLSLGENNEARKSFSEVERLNPHYRQLQDRMSRIETN